MVPPMTSSDAHDLSARLEGAWAEGRLPTLRGSRRIDGPGSSDEGLPPTQGQACRDFNEAAKANATVLK